ncbi:hypothetical protein O3P69_006313 [Scylla paramamosain]|uniref:Uncharacterized protein n=1 Tax=Scylla paramamosain TaxID=85552 RepID=A0AAW0U5H2_SCYPA
MTYIRLLSLLTSHIRCRQHCLAAGHLTFRIPEGWCGAYIIQQCVEEQISLNLFCPAMQLESLQSSRLPTAATVQQGYRNSSRKGGVSQDAELAVDPDDFALDRVAASVNEGES